MGSIKINNKEIFTSNTEGLHVGTDYPTGAVIAAHCFRTDDEEFNEVKTDYRGNPAYSTMITKLCNFSFRSEYILDILSKELQEYPDQQVMILAHNKALLVYLYNF